MNPEVLINDAIKKVACRADVSGQSSAYKIIREYKSEGALHSKIVKNSKEQQ